MAETTKIIIKQEYFDNVKVAIDALNNFFGSNFKTKNFPMIDSNEQLDSSLLSILSWMNNVDPTWVEDPDRMNDVIDKINEAADNYEGDDDLLTSLTNDNDTSMLDAINAIIGHKMLQYIADHFEVFSELLNGIYTFELFTKPSMFNKALDTFTKPVPMDEIANALGDNKYQIFNEEKYIHGIFDNPQITLPKTMKVETEQTRFDNREDLKNVEINVDETVQEQAEINYFVEMRPEHLRYNPGLQVVQISKQFEAKVNKLVSDLRACTTTDDLKKYFENFPFSPDDFTHVVIPAILARVFASSRKFPNQSFDQTGLKKYTDSYKSILSQNDGAKRFGNYDVFSTFKADKEGTIKFIEDFMKLRLVNDEAGMISNQTLLTVFNIFDSRIYLDIMYNMLPNDVRTSKAPSEDAFVKKVRAKINKNSRNANVYQKKPAPVNNVVPTSDQVVEYVSEAFTGTETISDLRYCEHYLDIIHKEIDTLGDSLYNHGVSVSELEEYIGEAYDIDELYMEGPGPDVDGSIPDYMKTRIALSDGDEDTEDSPKKPVVTDVQLPPDIPSNSFDDLGNSIDARLDTETDKLDNVLGSGYQGDVSKQGGEGRVVYNITYNYNNSYNQTNSNNKTEKNSHNITDTHNTTTDSSTGKTTNHNSFQNSFNSTNKRNTVNSHNVNNPRKRGSNNNNNSTVLSDTKDSNAVDTSKKDTFSTGKTIQEVFAFLESEEPLSNTMSAPMDLPKEDSLTKAMDNDKKSLPKLQAAKKGLQKIGNTARSIVKPITRTKQWLTQMVNSLIKRDEDKTKQDIMENDSYRSSLCKAARVALKLGLFGVFTAITPWLGAAYAALEAVKLKDRDRIRKEIQDEFATEIKIMDEKIEQCKHEMNYGYGGQPDPKKKQELYRLIRIRDKMRRMAPQAMRSPIVKDSNIY